MTNTKRTAIVFVHGQGEQRPMDSVRELVRTAWATDPKFGGSGDAEDWLRYWSIPDERSDSYEMHRLSTEAVEIEDPNFTHERFDFYEYYWAHLMSGTSFGHVWSWFQKLVKRRVSEVPNSLLRVRQILIRMLEMSIAFSIVGMALCIHFIHFNICGEDPPCKSTGAHWAANWVFEPITEYALLIALFAAPLIGVLSIVGDQVRTASNRAHFSIRGREQARPFNPGNWPKNLILGLGALMIPLIGLQSSSEGQLQAGILDALILALVLTAVLLCARVVMGAAILGVVGLCVGLVTVIALEFNHPKVISDLLPIIDQNIVLVPVIVCVAAAAMFYLVSKLGSYTIALLIAAITVAAGLWAGQHYIELSWEEFQADHRVQIAATAAAWAVAYALLLPEAARFNLSGAAEKKDNFRGNHSAQFGMWLLVPLAIWILANDPAFNEEIGWLGIFPLAISIDPLEITWNQKFTAAFVIPVIYTLVWIGTQFLWPVISNAKNANNPQRLKVVTQPGFLIGHLLMWFTWCVFFQTAVFEGAPWPAYWMFMATLFALPSLVVLLVAANRSFLIPVLGDSARYLSPIPDNIEARQRIRETGVQLLESLHKGRPYDRIIVVAHSLGSVVALDILKQFWARRVDHLHDPRFADLLDKVEGSAAKLDNSSSAGETNLTTENRQAFRKAQGDYGKALREQRIEKTQAFKIEKELEEQGQDSPENGVELEASDEMAWRISDFITLGSPLTYAPFLLADTDKDFRRRLAKFELPSCPPSRDLLKEEHYLKGSDGLFVYDKWSAKKKGRFPGPRHGSIFSAVRWTNLYFATPGMVTGDLIGGELETKFGYGVESYIICERPRKTRFAHNEYWKWSPASGTEGKSGHQVRQALMKETVPEHVVALRAALNLADEIELKPVEEQVAETCHETRDS